MPECTMCRDVGWLLDGDPAKDPLALELLACPIPDCRASGRRIEVLSVNAGRFSKVAREPRSRYVMSLGLGAGRVVIE